MMDTPYKIRVSCRTSKKPAAPSHKMHNTNALRERLMQEMLELNKQKQHLETGADSIDLSLIQSYKMMIQSRHDLLAQLNQEI